jgi:hypothetical protein
MKRSGRIVLLDSCPPKVPDNRSDFGYEGFGEENGRHVINGN